MSGRAAKAARRGDGWTRTDRAATYAVRQLATPVQVSGYTPRVSWWRRVWAWVTRP